MFSSELDRAQYPLFSRVRGILLGTLLMVAVTASLVSARSLAVTYWIVAAGFLTAVAFDRNVDLKRSGPGPVAICLGVFLLYALLSAAWAVQPDIALTKALTAVALAATVLLIVPAIVNETRPNLLHMCEGVCIGLFLGLIYLLIELLTEQSIKLSLFRAMGLGPADLNPPSFFKWDGTHLLSISDNVVTRNIAPAAIFLWPAVMMINGAWGTPGRRTRPILLVLLTVTVVMMSSHESSKLALVVSLGAFGLAHVSRRWVARLVMLAWVFACLAVVPAVLLAHRLDLHNASYLQQSARQRLVIWNFTAEKMLDSPWMGTGANMTYVLGPAIERETSPVPGETLPKTLSIHSHSIYLQTWFELGVLGAALLTLVGLAILSAIRALAPQLHSYAYATFASAAAMAATSYGMWQVWFMAAFGLCTLLFWIGAGLLQRSATDVERGDLVASVQRDSEC